MVTTRSSIQFLKPGVILFTGTKRNPRPGVIAFDKRCCVCQRRPPVVTLDCCPETLEVTDDLEAEIIAVTGDLQNCFVVGDKRTLINVDDIWTIDGTSENWHNRGTNDNWQGVSFTCVNDDEFQAGWDANSTAECPLTPAEWEQISGDCGETKAGFEVVFKVTQPDDPGDPCFCIGGSITFKFTIKP